MLESTREKEAALKKETQEQLDAFRKQREEADRKVVLDEGGDDNDIGEREGLAMSKKSSLEADSNNTQWTVGVKKRKRAREKEGIKGVKLLRRASSSTATASKTTDDASPEDTKSSTTAATEAHHVQQRSTPPRANNASGDRRESQMGREIELQSSDAAATVETTKSTSPQPSSPRNISALGLADYSSDED